MENNEKTMSKKFNTALCEAVTVNYPITLNCLMCRNTTKKLSSWYDNLGSMSSCTEH